MKFICQRCGRCCRLFNPFGNKDPCPQLDYNKDGAFCKIYNKRPEICRENPKNGKCDTRSRIKITKG